MVLTQCTMISMTNLALTGLEHTKSHTNVLPLFGKLDERFEESYDYQPERAAGAAKVPPRPPGIAATAFVERRKA
jgi:hypothetical protein